MAMIVDAFVPKIMELVGQLVVDEVGLLLGVPDEIEKLQETLGNIQNVLADAERRRIESKAINNWIKRLKDVMYDADDILDLCRIKADKSSRSKTSVIRDKHLQLSCLLPLISCFRNPVFSHNIGTRMRDLNKRLEVISKGKDDLKLIDSAGCSRDMTQIIDSTSPLEEPDIVGAQIDEDTNSLVELLTSEQLDTKTKNFVVYAIVGIGGVGKTTLGQRIYNDEKIKDRFSFRIWICISQEFKAEDVLRTLIRGLGGSCGSDQGRSELELIVQGLIRGRKFLLFLDDVWSDKIWNSLLKKILHRSEMGSRVLMTSRNGAVAEQMNAVRPHHQVETLTPEVGWLLLQNTAGLNGDERDLEVLQDMGMQIISKCGGLPLAIKTIGRVLSKDKTRSWWESQLNSTTWSTAGLPEEVNTSLYLSYMDLPSELKQCFLYCSFFQEDSVMRMHILVELWIAEGFVKASCNLLLEELGECYYKELIWRNLLQIDRKTGYEYSCKMHDLLRTLGQFLTQDENLSIIEMQDLSNRRGRSPAKLRRLCLEGCTEMAAIPEEYLKNQKSLRSLMLSGNTKINQLDGRLLLSYLRMLRVLDLADTLISELPNSLDCLVHLRYLNVSGTPVISLPETIGDLSNLQFLVCKGCGNLRHLPSSIVDLHNLRCLDLMYTKVESMPVGIERLKNLCTFYGFPLQWKDNERGCSTLQDLEPLSKLQFLEVRNLERVSDISDVPSAVLADKPHLISLILRCNPLRENGTNIVKVVFEQLRPSHGLDELTIDGYFDHVFPSWMVEMASSSTLVLSNLRSLVLENSYHCEQLPYLGHLPNLEYLTVWGAPLVTVIGVSGGVAEGGHHSSSPSSSSSIFPKLKQFWISEMPNLEEWKWGKGVQAMPNLHKMKIIKCPRLKSLPEGLLCHATSLTDLEIAGADSLRAVENLLSLRDLVVVSCANLERVSDLPTLRKLTIDNCPKLHVMQGLCSLKTIELSNFENNSFPEWLLYYTDMKEDKISAITIKLSNVVPDDRLSRAREELEGDLEHGSVK